MNKSSKTPAPKVVGRKAIRKTPRGAIRNTKPHEHQPCRQARSPACARPASSQR